MEETKQSLTGTKRNLALKRIRKATGMRQPQFAMLIGFSASMITSVETGRRRASREFANKIAGKTGAAPDPIFRHDDVALDHKGDPYTRESYKEFLAARAQELSDEELDAFVNPVRTAIAGAADKGRLAIFMPMLNEAVENIIQTIDGVQEAVEKRRGPAYVHAEWINNFELCDAPKNEQQHTAAISKDSVLLTLHELLTDALVLVNSQKNHSLESRVNTA